MMAADDPPPTPLSELSGLERDILVAAAGREAMSGVEIRDALTRAYDDPTAITGSDLYPHLERLVGHGYLDKRDRATDGRTNEYPLTAFGREATLAYRRWVVERVPPAGP